MAEETRETVFTISYTWQYQRWWKACIKMSYEQSIFEFAEPLKKQCLGVQHKIPQVQSTMARDKFTRL
jgi:hypothetical protein